MALPLVLVGFAVAAARFFTKRLAKAPIFLSVAGMSQQDGEQGTEDSEQSLRYGHVCYMRVMTFRGG